MEELYITLAYLTAGVSLSMGSISFFIGLQRRNNTDLIFGVMGLCLFAFLMLPPAGFILIDHPPYGLDIIVKRAFIFAYYALFPWFIKFYTGKQNSRIPLLISIYVVAVYGIMVFTTVDSPPGVWSLPAEVALRSTG